MPLPRAVARFNKRFTNRWIEPVVARSSGFATVSHVGRRSGRRYQTPVNVFWLDSTERAPSNENAGGRTAIIALTYGPSADWIQNVMAGPAELEITGVDGPAHMTVSAVELVGRPTVWQSLPRFIRLALRLLSVRDFALLSVSGPDTSR